MLEVRKNGTLCGQLHKQGSEKGHKCPECLKKPNQKDSWDSKDKKRTKIHKFVKQLKSAKPTDKGTDSEYDFVVDSSFETPESGSRSGLDCRKIIRAARLSG